MEKPIVKTEQAKRTSQHSEAIALPQGRKAYQKPTLTKYKRLSEITLGMMCNTTLPDCSPAMDPVN